MLPMTTIREETGAGAGVRVGERAGAQSGVGAGAGAICLYNIQGFSVGLNYII